MPRTTKRQQQLASLPSEIHDDPLAWARSYQIPILHAFFIQHRRFFVQVHNRKTGKDYLWAMIAKMFMLDAYGNHGKSPLVIHAFPDFKTARETIWDGPCDKGRFIDVIFPPALREEFSDTECMLRLKDGYGTKTGPVYQLQGSKERMQSRRGPNATGVILSEYQDHAETVYEEIYEPMIESNRGWAAFIGTPHGENHLKKKLDYALMEMRTNPKSLWYASLLTCETTKRDAPGEDGERVMTEAQIDAMRRRGVDEAIIQQEHFCSFQGTAQGSIFGANLRQAEKEGRVARILREANLPVGCCLDIGRSDGTAVWFYQTIGREVHLIDYLAFKANTIGRMSAAEYAIKRIKERPYIVTRIVLPHDAKIKGYSAVDSTYDIFLAAFQDVQIAENADGLAKIPVEQGIEMVRGLFTRLFLDVDKCGLPQDDDLPSGIDSLRGYHRARSAATDAFDGTPVHDKYSHGADALRYGAMEGFSPLEFYTDWQDRGAPPVETMASPWAIQPAGGRR